MRFTHFSKSMKRLARMLLHMAVILFTSGPVFAAYNVNISSAPSVNGAWSGGSPDTWSPSETGANVSIYEILAKLNAGFDVNIVTAGAGSDAGNINVNAKLSWNTSILTLSAQKDININAVMSASNQASLAMSYGMDGNVVNPSELKVAFKPGEANGFAGRIDFPGRSGIGFLTINGVGYTVINSLGLPGSTTGTDLQGIAGNLAGKYALGSDINASETIGWNPIGAGFLPIGDNSMIVVDETRADESRFTGVFDGFGHTINGLVIDRQSTDNVGLFGYFGASAILRNVGVTDSHISGRNFVGGLVGNASGVIGNSYYSGYVSGEGTVGGLVGSNGAITSSSYSTGVVSNIKEAVGGLVGLNFSGSINGSYSTASVISNFDYVGGLVGSNILASIENSYATGRVESVGIYVGGLVGSNDFASITNSYSTGAVAGTSAVGGLVGGNSGTVTNSFWDTETSGQTISAGGSGVTSSAMKLPATFAGWDISSSDSSSSIWRITVGQTYPLLRTFIPSPTATSESATAVTTTGATLNGTVTANYAEALVSFEYGTTTAYGTTVSATPATVTSGSGNTTVGIAIGSLTPGQTYHYRVKATNSAGTGYGDDVVFTALKMSQTISGFSPPATATYNDGPITLSASSTSALPVVFSVTGGPGSINGNQLTITGAGTIYLQASQSGNFTYSAAPNVTASINVAKAVVTVNLNNLSQIYNGSARAATATAPEGLSVSITYNGSSTAPTNAGSYNVIATIINSSNFQGTANGTLVIAKATAAVTLGNLSQTYSGTAKPATATTNPAGKAVILTYDGSETAPTNAGTYAVVATINDPNYTGSASGALIIAKATPTIDWATPVYIYQGTALSATQLNATSSISGSFAYTPTAGQILPVDNNDLTVVFTPADTSNYNNASATVVINVRYKLDPIITWETPAAMTYGTALSATQLNASANIPGSLVYTSAPATVVTVGSILNAGVHSLTATFTPIDTVTYNNATRVVTLTINKAAASVSVGSQTRSYTGSALPATIATTPVGLNTSVTYNGNATAPTVAGTYAVVATINDPNYSGSASGTLTITKAIATVTLGNLSQPYDGAQKAATASTTPVGLAVTITYDGSEIVPTEIGSYAVVGTISDNNYQGSSTATLVITPPSLTVAMAGTGTGTVTSNPAGISCSKSSAADVTCTNNFSDTVNLYATPSVLSLFKGWGGACGGLGACSVTMSAGQTVTATFNAAPLLHIDGTTYPTLQAAYDAAADGSFIQLLDNTVAGTLDANRNVTVKLKGGYDAGYLNNPGTTALTAPLTVRQGAVVVDRIVIK